MKQRTSISISTGTLDIFSWLFWAHSLTWVNCAFGNSCNIPHLWYQGSINIKTFSFPGKDQTLQIPDITVCHEHPYKSLERIDEMVKSKGYEENTYGLSDLVAHSHRNYSVQTVSFFTKHYVIKKIDSFPDYLTTLTYSALLDHKSLTKYEVSNCISWPLKEKFRWTQFSMGNASHSIEGTNQAPLGWLLELRWKRANTTRSLQLLHDLCWYLTKGLSLTPKKGKVFMKI